MRWSVEKLWQLFIRRVGFSSLNIKWNIQEERYEDRISQDPQHKIQASPDDIGLSMELKSTVRKSLAFQVQESEM